MAAERLGREAAVHSFGGSARALSIDWNMALDAKQVQRWSERLGEACVKQRQTEARDFGRGIRPQPPANAPELLVIGMDGGRVQTDQKDPSTGSRWKEDKVASITSYLPGDGKDRKPAPLVGTYVATMGHAQEFGPLVATEAHRRGASLAKTVLNISDGASWVDTVEQAWRLADVRIIDFYHASEHLHEAGEAIFGRQTPEAQAWWESRRDELYRGEVQAVIAQLEQQAKKAGPVRSTDPPTHRRRVLWQHLGYFQKHQQHMNYDQYRARGWPIGSGPTEAGVKGFNKRVKGTDQFWSYNGVEAILALRELWMDQDGRWERYWANRSAYGFAQAA